RLGGPATRGRPAGQRSVRTHALAATLYLGLALWAMRVMLPAPATLVPYAARLEANPAFLRLDRGDQLFEAAGIVRSARAFLGRPWRLFAGDCFPTPRS